MSYIDVVQHTSLSWLIHAWPYMTKRCSIKLKDEEAEIEMTGSQIKQEAPETNTFKMAETRKRTNSCHFDSKNRRSLPKWSGGDLWAKFPHSPILHYAYSPLLEENNNANNRLPLGQFALFSRSWIFFKSIFKPSFLRILLCE